MALRGTALLAMWLPLVCRSGGKDPAVDGILKE
jgi:hypothetical protein